MICPKCGYKRQSRDDAFVPPGECPACGVVYAKHDTTNESTVVVQPMPAPNLKPSPVDAFSLRKARERVEKRLREQQGKRIQDDRHARTLELAKQLASEEVRKRQEEWKQAHADPEEPVEADAGEESQAPVPEVEAAQEDDFSAHPTQDADQPPDEAMASPAMEETADSPEPTVENPAEAADDGDAAAAGDSRETPEFVPDDDVGTLPLEVTGAAAEEEAPLAAASLTTDLEAEDPASPADMPAAHVATAALSGAPQSGSRSGLSRLLPVVAWLILGAGVIGAVLSWTTINEVEAGLRIPMAEGLINLPLGLLLGFAYLATGVLGFAFFWVSSLISTQLRDIYHLLLPAEHDENTLQDKTA